MTAPDMAQALNCQLEERGYKVKIVSIEHVSELQRELEEQYQGGLFDEEFYQEELTFFDFRIPPGLPEAKSLIVVAALQPQVRITFNWEGRSFPCIIPPTYSYSTDRMVKDILEAQLKPKGYHLDKTALPLKLLAVRSGLAQYGRNNISYVNGMASFHRLAAFYSDLPCYEDSWNELALMEHCESCFACVKACPTGALTSDRFLLRGERCITFHNERKGTFPEWIRPSWHNCLVGCLYCQKVCPLDKDFLDLIKAGPTFSEMETASVLRGDPKQRVAAETIRKLKELDMIEYFEVMGRNLRALIQKKG